MQYVNWIIENWEVIPAVIGAFAVIAAATPNKADNAVADILCKVVNVLGANFGKAANK